MHAHDRGLAFDLDTLRDRRAVLGLFGGLAVLAAGCSATDTPSAASSSTTPANSSSSATEEIPSETAGPFPGDGSNGPNVLTESGIVRSDIRASFGSASGVAEGVPLRIELTVVEADTGEPLPGAAVYLWHCTATGGYSLYSQGVENENYLRGVQEADDAGKIVFTTVFPGAYSGRWPHAHFEVYPRLADATEAGAVLVTSQLALPEDACAAVYAGDGYGDSARNLEQTSVDSDLVFSDGWDRQLCTVTGDAARGYTATLTVPV